MAKSNFIVRGGADFSKIKHELTKTQAQLRTFQNTTTKSMGLIASGIEFALGYVSVRAMGRFIKSATEVASDLTEVQNVVDVTFGSMAKDIDDFASTAIEQFGLSELNAKKFSSSMGAMLKSSGIAGEAVRDMALDLTKLSADMASFYNLENEEAFRKIMSGMSGMTQPLKELGINMNIANLEAYALSQGIRKSWQQMSQAEQTMLRYQYLLSVTGDAQGDFARNAHTWANQTKILSQQFEILKGTIGAGFINMLMPVVRWLNTLIKHIQVAAEYFKAFTRLIFGDAEAGSQGGAVLEDVADSLGNVEDGLGGVGNAGKKAARDLKGTLASFDEIHNLADKAAGSLGGAGGGIGGVNPVDFGELSTGKLDIKVDTKKAEANLKKVKKLLKEIYEKWGAKDFFEGFREGLELINFEGIRENFRTVFTNFGEIARTAVKELQPAFKAMGEAWGTAIKYGIASAGNYFEAISLGWANFSENMKRPIQDWIVETYQTITEGFNNLTTVYEILGSSWLESIEKYKPQIAESTEDTLTNVAETYMLISTIVADTFNIITSKVKEFVEENEEDIQKFNDSILGIFTDVWDAINTVWTDVLDSISQFWDDWGKDIVDTVMGIVNDISRWFLYLWNEVVKPVWNTMTSWLSKIWNNNLKDIISALLRFVGKVGELISIVWNNTLKPLIDNMIRIFGPAIRNVLEFVIDIFGNLLDGVGGVIKNILGIFSGLIDFLAGIFTWDWKRTWQGLVDIFKGIFGAISSAVKGVLNAVISIVNRFNSALNKIKIPDFVPGIGGKGFNLKHIPYLATGAITGVNSPFMAVVGDHPTQREVISPLDDLMSMVTNAVLQANQVSGGGTGSGVNDQPIIINVNTEYGTIGQVVIKSLQDYARQHGDLPLPI